MNIEIDISTNVSPNILKYLNEHLASKVFIQVESELRKIDNQIEIFKTQRNETKEVFYQKKNGLYTYTVLFY